MMDWNHRDQYPVMIDVLRNDELLLASSDTVLGLFAQLSEKAKKRLDFVKKRNLKPYIILLKSADLLHNFTDQQVTPAMQNIINQYWPGPLTILFKAHANLPVWMIGAHGTVAIRIPAHEGLQELLEHVPGLFTTSANISDQPLPKSYAEISPEILQQVPLVCCHETTVYDGPASTIIDFSSGSIKIIRMGVVVVDSI